MAKLLTLNELADWMRSAMLKIKVENVLRLLCSASIMRYQSADEKNHYHQLLSLAITYRSDTTSDGGNQRQDKEQDEEVQNLHVDLSLDICAFDRCITTCQLGLLLLA
jgi:hypothetical protein